MAKAKTTVLLCIMDGFGMRPAADDNAITSANTPTFDRLQANKNYFTQIDGSAEAVGLPSGQMGNSEVGHLNIGAGRVVYQDVSRIDRAIESGEFVKNEIMRDAFTRLASEKKALHLFGLVSDGLVHASLEHIYAIIKLAKKCQLKQVYLHAFMDGRDTPPHSGEKYMTQVLDQFKKIGLGQVATVAGRYWGMDRDRRWERSEKSYQAIVNKVGLKATDPVEAIRASYKQKITDEFIEPIILDLGSPKAGRLQNGDTALIFNFRADRVRQLSYQLLGYPDSGEAHPENPKIDLITMTNYDKSMTAAKVLYERIELKQILGQVIANAGLKQLRTAETEKYAHVTFFFNGGVEEPLPGEDRDLVPSPKVATYDLQPEMSAAEVTSNALEKIGSQQYDLIVLNYANCDMVGHTGDFEAAKKAVETVDSSVGELLEKLAQISGVALVTADHGNAEKMFDPDTNGPWTAHTTSLVPFAIVDSSGRLGKNITMRDGGILADIAPTILDILSIDKPDEMTGRSLFNRG